MCAKHIYWVYCCNQIKPRANLMDIFLMTCIIVFVLHANNVDISEMPFPNNTNYSHLGGKSNHILNSLMSLIAIFTQSL